MRVFTGYTVVLFVSSNRVVCCVGVSLYGTDLLFLSCASTGTAVEYTYHHRPKVAPSTHRDYGVRRLRISSNRSSEGWSRGVEVKRQRQKSPPPPVVELARGFLDESLTLSLPSFRRLIAFIYRVVWQWGQSR